MFLWITGALAGKSKGLSILFNRYEPHQMARARETITPNDICFDIGANVGIYSLLFAQNAQHVFSFEPLPRNIVYLYGTLKLNRIKNATIVPFAVAENIKLTCFQEGEDWGVGKITADGNQPAVTISCDEFAKKYNVVPTFMKIDVEGAELDVLHGAEELLSLHKTSLMLSVHGENLRTNCLTYLKSIGYNNVEPIDNSNVKNAHDYLIKAG